MKKSKKLLALVLCAAMALSLFAGCGSSNQASAPAATATEAPAQQASGSANTETAQETPTDAPKPTTWEWGDITIVVPFKAGGGADTVARLLAEYWGKELGANFVIDNRKGANTEIGNTYYVKETPKDCTALLMGVEIYYASCIQAQNADYDFDDVTVMNFIELDPCNIVVRPDSPYQTFDELNKAVLANPGKFSISATAGGDQMMMIGVLAEQLGWDVKVINYDGGATERLAALLGGHVDMCATTLSGSLDQEVTQILVTAPERNPKVPDVPTIREVTGDDSLPFMGSSRFIGIHASAIEEYPERFELLYSTLEKIMQPGTDYMKAVAAANRDSVTAWRDWDTNQKLQADFWESCTKYLNYLTSE